MNNKVKKRKHRHRYEFWEDVNKAPFCNLIYICGKVRPLNNKGEGR